MFCFQLLLSSSNNIELRSNLDIIVISRRLIELVKPANVYKCKWNGI